MTLFEAVEQTGKSAFILAKGLPESMDANSFYKAWKGTIPKPLYKDALIKAVNDHLPKDQQLTVNDIKWGTPDSPKIRKERKNE